MYRPLVLFISIRYILGKNKDSFGRFIAFLSMLGLMLGAIALIVVLSVMNGLERQMEQSILRFLPQAIVTTAHNQLDPILYPKTSLSGLKGVTSITPLVTGTVILQSSQNLAVVQLMGVLPGKREPISPFIYIGNLADLRPNQYGIIIGATLAEQLHVAVGDSLRLITTNTSKITLIGQIPNQRIFTVRGIFSVNNDINQSLIFANLDDAAKLFSLPKGQITGWRLYLQDPLAIADVAAQPLTGSLQITDWRQDRGELFTAIKLEKKTMGLLISLIVIVAAFNIITSLSLVVIEKQREVAILKTQGISQHGIMIIFILQGAMAGIIGTVLGTGLGIFLTRHLDVILKILPLSVAGIGLPVQIDFWQVSVIMAVLIALALITTLYPAWKAAKIFPAETLRYE